MSKMLGVTVYTQAKGMSYERRMAMFKDEERLKKVTINYLLQIVPPAVRLAKELSPRRTGAFARGIIWGLSSWRTVRITYMAPHSPYVVKGVRRHQMTYLLKPGERRKVVRFVPKGGKVPIFRTVTPENLARGAWWHPGYAGRDPVREAWGSPAMVNLRRRQRVLVFDP